MEKQQQNQLKQLTKHFTEQLNETKASFTEQFTAQQTEIRALETKEVLVNYLENCVEALVQAERHELIKHVASLLLPIYEKCLLSKRQSCLYGKLQKACDKVKSRFLGTYYRVAFYGQAFKEEDRKQYVYKEPRITELSTFKNRLQDLYREKLGVKKFEIIQDSDKVKPENLDPSLAYIQLTCVEPYFEEDQADIKADFEKHHDIKRFMFETPYTLVAGRKHGSIEDQWKRKTVLTTSHTFPYVKKRLEVVEQEEWELKPIIIAIDELKKKIFKLTRLCTSDAVDKIMLEMELGGSVAASVNPGPVAYARAFLDGNKPSQSTNEVNELKEQLRKFVQVCRAALDNYENLIEENQMEHHKHLLNQFNSMEEEISALIAQHTNRDGQST